MISDQLEKFQTMQEDIKHLRHESSMMIGNVINELRDMTIGEAFSARLIRLNFSTAGMTWQHIKQELN